MADKFSGKYEMTEMVNYEKLLEKIGYACAHGEAHSCCKTDTHGKVTCESAAKGDTCCKADSQGKTTCKQAGVGVGKHTMEVAVHGNDWIIKRCVCGKDEEVKFTVGKESATTTYGKPVKINANMTPDGKLHMIVKGEKHNYDVTWTLEGAVLVAAITCEGVDAVVKYKKLSRPEMKLLVHNFLASKFLKGVTTGFPLKLVATKVDVKESELNPEFIKKMVPRLDWSALKFAASCIKSNDLPETLPPAWEEDEGLMRNLHRLLVETDVQEGYLECPETGRQFPIKDGIPNMLADEDEVA